MNKYNCCNKRIDKIKNKNYYSVINIDFITKINSFKNTNESAFKVGDYLCNKCDTKIRRWFKKYKKSWYCTCKSGLRTVDCCSHIASIILYFSYFKYLESVPNPAKKLTEIFLYRKSISSEEEDEDNRNDNISKSISIIKKTIGYENKGCFQLDNEKLKIIKEVIVSIDSDKWNLAICSNKVKSFSLY